MMKHISNRLALILSVSMLCACSYGGDSNSGIIVENGVNANTQMNTGIDVEIDTVVEIEDAPEVSLEASPDVVMPMDRAIERITKKPFGVLIDPTTSPVQPERFSGYHVGTDFEVFDNELSQDIYVYAICTGKILSVSRVNGYGGVVTQACRIDDRDVRIVYGHVAIDDLDIVNRVVNVGEKITKLGDHESSETDHERKHLHLGIVKGTEKNLRGYVQDEIEVTKWLDIETLIEQL